MRDVTIAFTWRDMTGCNSFGSQIFTLAEHMQEIFILFYFRTFAMKEKINTARNIYFISHVLFQWV